MDIVLLIAGLVVLVASGEVLVRGAAGIALKADIPPLIVGLTVVSIGTSAPELFASVTAALEGNPGLSIGNVVGSNIANLALVLGITAIIYPIPVSRGVLRFDGPVMVAMTLLFIFFMWDRELVAYEGGILVGLMIAFILVLIRRSRIERKKQLEADAAREFETDADEFDGFKKRSYLLLTGLVIAGCIGLYFGSNWFVGGASGIAKSLGVSDYVIGVTIVAFGTSVPELVASVIAALRHQTDISIGNLIGSNIFNILSVIGITSLVKPLPVDGALLANDVWWMLGIALLIFPLIRMGYKIVRWNGILLLAIYIIYIVLVLF
ncbi:MAG: calcium/sodium antiporter [Flavobacteriales bacterium]|nr:calcium/sodium antiporter [Flavobacteriales bacterium]